MRIGIVCPYSLTVPGGVQAQVLGLARELRRRGHETRVLGPCDGPPPESFVTPLGMSLPLSANGSIAPLAPDPSAALRTLQVLADEDFDVLQPVVVIYAQEPELLNDQAILREHLTHFVFIKVLVTFLPFTLPERFTQKNDFGDVASEITQAEGNPPGTIALVLDVKGFIFTREDLEFLPGIRVLKTDLNGCIQGA